MVRNIGDYQKKKKKKSMLRLTQGLLFKREEDGVQQFQIFEVVVDHVVELHSLHAV
jgi:hypothetical protein